MRLAAEQANVIRDAVARVYGGAAQAVPLGSRVDNECRGGDIDLLVRPDPERADGSVKRKLRFLAELERALGERQIDIIVEEPGDRRAIVELARRNGELL